MSKQKQTLEVTPELRRGGKKDDAEKYVSDGAALLEYMSAVLGLPNLGASDVLDIGCGTKFTQAILNYGIPIGNYVGIDVYKPMIEYLQQSIDDPRFSFHHMDTHNDMYNPTGRALTPDTPLPVENQVFDIICLFSVFTHLAPHDYVNMLHVARPYIKDSGKLIFSLFLDERSGNGHGLIEQIAEESGADWKPGGQPFRDAYPGKPLQWALYSRDYALQLVAGSGWKVHELLMPTANAQHQLICTPD